MELERNNKKQVEGDVVDSLKIAENPLGAHPRVVTIIHNDMQMSCQFGLLSSHS